MMDVTEQYALGLLSEECGEVTQLVGKALRFGIDTPGVKDALTGHIDMEKTPRTALQDECGDILAAVEYACARGLLDIEKITERHRTKLNKLLNPESRDNLGRRLAP